MSILQRILFSVLGHRTHALQARHEPRDPGPSALTRPAGGPGAWTCAPWVGLDFESEVGER